MMIAYNKCPLDPKYGGDRQASTVPPKTLDCFVASLLAMTVIATRLATMVIASKAKQLVYLAVRQSIIIALIAVVFCACVKVPEYCSDGNKLDPETHFCFEGKAYQRCGVNEFNPFAEFCSSAKTIYRKCGGKNFDPAAQICVNGELEARITRFTVSFNTNGGAPAYILPVTVDSGAFFVVSIPDKPTKDGYDFVGWFNEANTKYDMLTVITQAANLTARWAEIPKYTVAYNGNGNTGGAVPVDNNSPYLSGSLVTVRAPGVLAKNGYKFCGWNTSEYEIGASYAAGNLLEIRENVTLYAKWTNGAITTYTVDVLSAGTGASGSSDYAAGATVAITAGTPPPGQRFRNWTVTDGNVIFDNANNAATEFTMPASAVTVTANFGEIPKYAVTVSSVGAGAFGNGIYAVGDTVTITAGTPPVGQPFIKWIVTSGGVTLANPNSAITTFIMPTNTVTVTAVFEQTSPPVTTPTTYAVTVAAGTGATGGGSYATGETVTITAGTAPAGQSFKNWSVTNGGATLANPNNATTMFAMPANAVIVTAVFERASGTSTPGPNLSYGGQTYRTVIIGGKTWMAENLNYATSDGSWCYDDDEANCGIYGRLYDWNTAMAVCPTGWHLPSDDEWEKLILMGDWWTAGMRLKSTIGWYNSGNGTDDYGFSALPGGNRYSDGSFSNAGNYGYWWTATEDGSSGAYRRGMYYYSDNVSEYGNVKGFGFSVRCRRD